MNSSTLRRLAADHASLQTSELPPYYLFHPSASSSSPDDLTQLTILLTGPQGTPYSQGLWKLSLKIPDDYPKSPPKASFRTRIWHPNVDENAGSVCVDTLKRDWQPKLTLRDVLITISCLLIQPNPNSALNATAGHLIQDNYVSFAKQARLMTSIHASIPPDLKDAALIAKRRGEDPGTTVLEDTEQRPIMKAKSASSSTLIMKKLPQRIMSSQSAPIPHRLNKSGDESSSEEEEEGSASKENDPMLSPSAVPAQNPRRPSLLKRPLSDLPTPTEPDSTEESCLSPSDQNILNNSFPLAIDAISNESHKAHQQSQQNPIVHFTGCGLQNANPNGLAALPLQQRSFDDCARPTKRVCSDEAKENKSEKRPVERLPTRPAQSINGTGRATVSAPRQASVPGLLSTGSSKGKARVGLRRL